MLLSNLSSTSTIYIYEYTSPTGTLCYIDPEYRVSTNMISYSKIRCLRSWYGILQLLTARPAIAVTHELASVLEPVAGEKLIDEADKLATLGLYCAEFQRKDRPVLKNKVLPILKRLKAIADAAQRSTSMTRSTSPNHFICPILEDVMVDPCVAADGYTYVRRAIEQWFEESDSSPMTNLPLTSRSLTPNYTLLSAIMEWKSTA